MNQHASSTPNLLNTLTTFVAFRDCPPLAIGIHKEIKQRLSDLDDAELRTVLRRHTNSTKYLKAVAQNDKRFDLDGNAVGEITTEHRKLARDTLKERFQKMEERKKAEAQQQERQQKLQQLAEKFNRR